MCNLPKIKYNIMFKKFFLVAVLFVAGSSLVKAQSNVIKLNVGSALFGEVMLSYERALNENMSVNVGVGFLTRSLNTSGYYGTASYDAKYSVTGIAIIPELRFYPGDKEAPRGFFVGPYLTYRNLTTKLSGDLSDGSGKVEGSVGASVFGGGGILGYQFVIGDVFAIDLFGGIGYYTGGTSDLKVKYPDGVEENYGGGTISVSGALPRFGLALGVAF